LNALPPIVSVRDLCVAVAATGGPRELLSGVSFDVHPGEVFALVGESGCGKSLTCLTLTRLQPEPPFAITGGRIQVCQRDILALSGAELRQLRGGVVSYIFQEPAASLNPVLRVGTQIAEAVRLHDRHERRVRRRVVELLRLVGIPDPESRLRAYPHQLSGGMQQRVMIAMALSCRPTLLVADEPTTALDVTIQAQILDLLRRLRRELGMAILLVTHNLAIVAGLADTVAVMYAGQIVERAPTAELLRHPRHPYTRALMDAVPRPGHGKARLATIPGRVPLPGQYPAGCRFAPRCACRCADCARPPSPAAVAAEHTLLCHRAGAAPVPPPGAARPA
jgi:oligopeptide/dipeptide ABC transporter ATP-binding protein